MNLIKGLISAAAVAVLCFSQPAAAAPPFDLLKDINLVPGPDGTSQLAEIQEALAWTGFYRGPTHGRETPDTRAAIAAFAGSIGETATSRLSQTSRTILFERADATQAGYRFARRDIEWLGMTAVIPSGFFGPGTLVQSDGVEEIHFSAPSHPSAARLSLWEPQYGGRASPQQTLSAVTNGLRQANADIQIIASGYYPDAYFITFRVSGFRIMRIAQVQQGKWKTAEYSVQDDYYWTLRPVMASVLTSLDMFAGNGLTDSEKRTRRAQGDYPGSEQVPEWFDSVVGNGSGSLVSGRGHILTNLHVIDGCDWITVNGIAANLIGTDARLDLGIIQAEGIANRRPIRFRESNPRLGEQVAVMGYPIFEISRALNYTTGIVSSTTGIRGDRTRLQITAPIQPGNSGGPVLDTAGRQVAVVVSKASATLQMESNVENIGWVIRGGQAVEFLRRFGVNPIIETQEPPISLPAASVVEDWRSRVLRIECHQYPR